MIYKTDNDEIQVTVDYYPTDGAQVIVSWWDGNDFICRYNSRVIADDLYETLTIALAGSELYAREMIDEQLAEWDVYPSDADCTCDDCTDN